MSAEEEEVLDGEVEVEESGTAVEHRPPGAALAAAPAASHGGALTTLWDTRRPAEIASQLAEVASTLADIIKQQDLSTNLGGKKDHVEIEGWQTAGTFLGLQAMTIDTARVHPMNQFRVKTTRKKWGKVDGKRQVIEENVHEWTCEGWSWEAVAEVRTMDGRVVGRGEAICSREEKNWFDSEDSAVKGMAQTRAQSRAFKQALGFIVGMAGYNTTPKEEMDAAGVKAEEAEPTGLDLAVATGAQKKALNQALLWLLPEAEAEVLWGAIKAQFGNEMYGPICEILTTVIAARKVLDEPVAEADSKEETATDK